MRVLIVASYNKGYYAPFIIEQADSLRKAGCTIDFFGVVGKGINGYLRCFPELKKKVKAFQPDIIHAHYGLCGLLAVLQRNVPVITTYHGSDINEKAVLPFSKIAMRLSRFNFFVSQKTIDIARPKKHYALIPCGVDLTDLQLTEKNEARKQMGLDLDKKCVLFAGAFDNPVKNYPLAKAAMSNVPEAELIELKGYNRGQVTLLMCAADCLLMTSHSEGSPQVIKEAMACGCPVVSVDVGDVKDVIDHVSGCYITETEAGKIAENILKAIDTTGKTSGRSKIISMGLSNDIVIDKIIEIYRKVI